MNKLSLEKRTKIIQLLVEGNSVRACARLTDVAFNTVLKLVVDVGKACIRFHSDTVVQVRSKRIQCDEMWSFVHSKDNNVKVEKYGVGSVWTWTAIDPDTKLIVSWFAGERTVQAAKFFMNDLWCRLRTRVQLSTDGLSAYREAVADTFGSRVDFAQLVKRYSKGAENKDGKIDRRERYIGAEKIVIVGNPDRRYITTSHVERQNLTMRMHTRRLARETNAFSKKIDNHCYALALYFVYYNFMKIHQTLRVTPAMEAKLTKRVMKIEDLIAFMDSLVTPPGKRGPYKKISN